VLFPDKSTIIGSVMNDDNRWMEKALEEAEKAFKAGEVPIGAVAVYGGELLSCAHNMVESLKDASAHAEMLVLKKSAAILDRWRLNGVHLYVTIEPCPMCAMAMVLFRIDRLVFGALEPRTGAAGSFVDLLNHSELNHQISIQPGVCAGRSKKLLESFFRARRSGFLSQNDVIVVGE